MRIAYIAAGAGAMYCGACNRDVALFRALVAAGQEVLVVPLYTPLLVEDELPLATAPLFMGGISLYLAQASGMFRRLPGAVRRLMDSPSLLRAVSRRAIQTDPRQLGPLTVGILEGVEGPHGGEIRRVVEFLRGEFRPDIVNLSFSLLSSLAPVVREVLGVPVVCMLQGEEAFIEALPEPFRGQATALVRRHAASIDRFIACSRERVATLAALLGVAESHIAVVPTGIDPAPYARTALKRNLSTIGYLSSIRPEKGLDVLIEAFGQLAHDRDLHLAIAGQILDQRYWQKIQRTIHDAGLDERVRYWGPLEQAGKAAFLHGCGVFVFPSRLHESRAIAVMEALAAGVPVVASHRGVVPELLANTGGGVTVACEDSAALAEGIRRLLEQPGVAEEMARKGPAAIAAHYSPKTMAQRTLGLYAECLSPEVASKKDAPMLQTAAP